MRLQLHIDPSLYNFKFSKPVYITVEWGTVFGKPEIIAYHNISPTISKHINNWELIETQAMAAVKSFVAKPELKISSTIPY